MEIRGKWHSETESVYDHQGWDISLEGGRIGFSTYCTANEGQMEKWTVKTARECAAALIAAADELEKGTPQ